MYCNLPLKHTYDTVGELKLYIRTCAWLCPYWFAWVKLPIAISCPYSMSVSQIYICLSPKQLLNIMYGCYGILVCAYPSIHPVLNKVTNCVRTHVVGISISHGFMELAASYGTIIGSWIDNVLNAYTRCWRHIIPYLKWFPPNFNSWRMQACH